MFGKLCLWTVCGWGALGLMVQAAAPEFFSAFNAKEGSGESPGVPAELRSPLELERVLRMARSGRPVESWREGLQPFLKPAGERGVGAALREMALYWEARARMALWDKHLRKVYARKAKYPESLEELLKQVPEEIKLDPWGEAWVYAQTAPPHSPQLVGQRYRLGPKRAPDLSVATEVGKGAPIKPPGALSFFSGGGVQAVTVRGGGAGMNGAYRVGELFGAYGVVWISKDGVLLSGPDGFVPVSF